MGTNLTKKPRSISLGFRVSEEEMQIINRNLLFSGHSDISEFIRNSVLEKPVSLKDISNDTTQSRSILEKLETTVELNKRLLFILLQNNYLTFSLAAQALVLISNDKERVNLFIEEIHKEALTKYNETKNF